VAVDAAGDSDRRLPATAWTLL